MATQMIDSITVTRSKVWKGAGRALVADEGTSFPGVLESVMNPSTPADGGTAYELSTDWSDLGPTTEDGVVVRRSAEVGDGIPVDQRQANLDEGEPDAWSMESELTLLHTDLDTIQIAWEGGNKRTISSGASNVAQHALDLDAPATFTERLFAVAQEDPKSGKLRVLVFRSAIPQVDGELAIKSGDASGLPLSLKLKSDPDIAEGSGQFGRIYEED